MGFSAAEEGQRGKSEDNIMKKPDGAKLGSPDARASDGSFSQQPAGLTNNVTFDGCRSSMDDFPTLLTYEESSEARAAFAKDAHLVDTTATYSGTGCLRDDGTDNLQNIAPVSNENIANAPRLGKIDSSRTTDIMNGEAMMSKSNSAGRDRRFDRIHGDATIQKRRSILAQCRSLFARCISYIRREHLLSEASGSLGDVGTYIPFAFGYNDKKIFAFDFLLVGSGIFNVATGYFFKVPMPVQPMKTIGAVALTENDVTVYEVISAGLFVGFCTFIVGILLRIRRLTGSTVGLIPIENLLKSAPSMIAGIQVALGVKLGMKGYQSISGTNILGYSDTWTFGFPMLALMFMCNFLTEHDKLPKVQIPVALIVFVLGLIVARIRMNDLPDAAAMAVDGGSISTGRTHLNMDPDVLSDTSAEFGIDFYNFIKHSIVNPNSGGLIFLGRLYQGFLSRGWSMGLAQLPLTLLNSVFSVSDWSEKKFGAAKKATTGEIAVSVGAMNMLGASFGFMPMCHGAGGLVAQSKFGAKSGLAVKILGWGKIIVGLTMGKLLLRLMKFFPEALLGNMLVVVGVELAITGIQGVADLKSTTAEEKRRKAKETFVCFFSVMVQLKTDTGIGFLTGAITWGMLWGMENMVQAYVNRIQEQVNTNASAEGAMGRVEGQTITEERNLIIKPETAMDDIATCIAADAVGNSGGSLLDVDECCGARGSAASSGKAPVRSHGECFGEWETWCIVM